MDEQTKRERFAECWDEYDSDRPFIGWALWIAKSRIVDFYRTQSRNQLVFSEELLQRLSETVVQQSDRRDQRREALELTDEQLSKKRNRRE